jgi:lipoprotein-anchoring transpeptidase ErfK/SrfK
VGGISTVQEAAGGNGCGNARSTDKTSPEYVRILAFSTRDDALKERQITANGTAFPRRRGLLVAATLLLCMSTAACGGPGGRSDSASAAVAKSITITPAADTGDVLPAAHVAVSSTRATLTHVDVTDATGSYLSGSFTDDRSSWTSTTPLEPATDYTVTVSAVGSNGHAGTRRSTFRTAGTEGTEALLVDNVQPGDGAQVGVGYPLIVNFNHQVHNRQAVTAALDVETFPHVDGAWFWIDAATADYRPEHFWPEGTVVTLHAHLTDVDAGDGLWGRADRTSQFTVGRSQIIYANVQTDAMHVERDGDTVASFAFSSGKPGWETRNGTKVISQKITDKTWTNTAIDAPDHYVLHSQWAMRMTDSGEFIHDAPWNATHMGEDNASHGCIGLLTADMSWLWDNTMIGDPVIVTGSPVPYVGIDNRIQDWNVPWSKWLAGNLDLSDHS